MKILFLTDNFPPEVNAPATRTYEHCVEWIKLGAEVTVITCFPNFPQGKVYSGYKNHWRELEVFDGIKVVRVWSYLASNKGIIKRALDYISFMITSFLAGLLIEADIIIATSPQFFTAISGRMLSFFKHKPWIMEVRDLWPDSIRAVGAMRGRFLFRYLQIEEKKCYLTARKIIVVTESFKENIIKKGIDSQKIEVIENGANLNLFVPRTKNNAILDIYHLRNKIILGYIGTIGMAHKLDFIIECAKNIAKTRPQYHFLIIGDGAEKKALEIKIDLENINNVTILNPIKKIDVPEYLSVFDAAIINLKKSELFKTVIPSKIFEAAAMNIPILLGVDGEARSLIEAYNAGLYYEPENERDFISKIDLLFSNPETMDYLKEGCRKLATNFDRRILATGMLTVIREAIE